MLKRLFIFLLIPFLLSSCTFKKEHDEIVFSSWGSVSEVEVLNEVIKNFEKDNPEIKINFIHTPQNYFQKIHLLFASNQAPDVIFINNLYLPVYKNKLLNLDYLINKKDFHQESLKAMSIDGKLYAIPRDISNLVFYRNKNLIKDTPQNLKELITVIKDVKPYGIGYERQFYYAIPYVLTMGEDIYKPKESIKFYKDFEGKYAPEPSQVGSSTLAQMFIEGKIGLYLSGRWMYPKINQCADFEWDVISFPGIVQLDSSGWAISKTTRHKKSAEKFVQYLSSKEIIDSFVSTDLIVPARKDSMKTFKNKIFLEAIEKSKALQISTDYRRYSDKMNKELENN